MFVFLFGLSMDYHVFILSRIRELRARGASHRGRGGRRHRQQRGVVTSAAVIMVAVFSIFATLSLIELKMIGVGLAAAVLIDATVVRGILLPAALALLGERSWYLPRWLSGCPGGLPGPAPLAGCWPGTVRPGAARPAVGAASGALPAGARGTAWQVNQPGPGQAWADHDAGTSPRPRAGPPPRAGYLAHRVRRGVLPGGGGAGRPGGDRRSRPGRPPRRSAPRPPRRRWPAGGGPGPRAGSSRPPWATPPPC